MVLNQFKLGVGPMSGLIVDLCLEYSKHNDYPLMIIASRNQVDYNSGYVYTTSELVNQIRCHSGYDKNRVLICRDHCGPYFSDKDKGKSLETAIQECKETIKHDISNGFDLIHIDVSRIDKDKQYDYAKILIEYALHLNPDIMLEFGSEDNVGENIEDSVSRIHEQLTFLSQYKHNVKFFVSQTGSLTKHKQVGLFNNELVSTAVSHTHSYDLLFKEHNADYLSSNELILRSQAGVDALNIAPQLGAIQTSVMLALGKKYSTEYENFSKYVLESGYWERWVTNDVTDDYTKVVASGHYCFNSVYASNLIGTMLKNDEPFMNNLRTELFNILDIYYEGLYENSFEIYY